MWIFWALLSAFSAAIRRTNEKQLTYTLHPLTISFVVQLLSLPVIFVTILITGDMLNPLTLGLGFWIPLLIVCVGFYPLNALLYLGAVKNGELSKVLPIQSLWPVFALAPAWLFLNEVPSLVAILGMLLIVCGVYALGLKGRQLHHPFQPFREDKSSFYMLLAIMLVAAAGILDKLAIQASNAIFYSLMSTIGACITLFITMRIQRVNELSRLKESLTNLSVTGLMQGASYISYLVALSMGPVAYVSAIRSSNVLIGSLLGIMLLKEKMTRPKALSFALILIGGTVLAVGS